MIHYLLSMFGVVALLISPFAGVNFLLSRGYDESAQ